jgi:hypothetical protein
MSQVHKQHQQQLLLAPWMPQLLQISTQLQWQQRQQQLNLLAQELLLVHRVSQPLVRQQLPRRQ